jgi:Flp pilus assembly pilin Flp
MNTINWRSVLLAVLAVAIIAHSRSIVAAVSGLRLGEIWQEFTGIIWSMPRLGRYTLVLGFLALLYITAYTLIRERVRR